MIENIDRLTYLAAHAPVEPQSWFHPAGAVMPPSIAIDASKRTPEEVALWDAWDEEHGDESRRQRLIQWPYAWARAVLEAEQARYPKISDVETFCRASFGSAAPIEPSPPFNPMTDLEPGLYTMTEAVPEGCSSLTACMYYKVEKYLGPRIVITNDRGDSIFARWAECPHLEGRDWTRVEVPERALWASSVGYYP